MTSSSDFFKAGGTLHLNAPSYVPRTADEEFYKRLLAGNFCYVLTSRQMGKSSLMIRTAARLRDQDIQTAIVDLSGLGTQLTSAQWYLGILTRLASELKLDLNVEAWCQARNALSVVQRFTDFMHDVVLMQVTGRVVIFIDEIDSTLKLDFTDDFFAAIRTFYNARASDPIYERLTFVLLGVASPSDLIENRNLTPFNIGHALDLQEVSRQEAKPLVTGLEERYPGHGQRLLDAIFTWTSGHPYLTQKLCAAATDQTDPTPPNIDLLVQRLFLDKDAQNEDNLQFVRSNVTAGKDKRRLLQLYQRIYAGKTVGEDERSPLHNRLKLIGLVRTVNGVLQVRNEIYRRVFNRAWIGQSIPTDWARIVTVASAVVAIAAVSLFVYIQWQNELRRFAINQETLVDPAASVNVRMISLAQMCAMDEEKSRTSFFALAQTEQVKLFKETGVKVVDHKLFDIVHCLELAPRATAAKGDQPLHQALATKLAELCDPYQGKQVHPDCQLMQVAHD